MILCKFIIAFCRGKDSAGFEPATCLRADCSPIELRIHMHNEKPPEKTSCAFRIGTLRSGTITTCSRYLDKFFPVRQTACDGRIRMGYTSPIFHRPCQPAYSRSPLGLRVSAEIYRTSFFFSSFEANRTSNRHDSFCTDLSYGWSSCVFIGNASENDEFGIRAHSSRPQRLAHHTNMICSFFAFTGILPACWGLPVHRFSNGL